MPTSPDKVLNLLVIFLILHAFWGLHAYILWRIHLRRKVPSPLPPVLSPVALMVPWKATESPLLAAPPWSFGFIAECLVLGVVFTAANIALGYALPAIIVEMQRQNSGEQG